MSDIETVGQQLFEALKKFNSEYVEAHLEESQSTRISYRGKKLESIDRSVSIGGNIRALVKGGWGFISFNSFEELTQKIEVAVKQAELVGKGEKQIAHVEPIVETIANDIENNPVFISLTEKKKLLDEYNSIIRETPKLQTSTIGYSDSNKSTIFINSSGSYIKQERADINLRLSAIAANDGDIQQVGLSLGSRGNFSHIEGLHKDIEQMSQGAVEMLAAPQAKSGEYTVVLDPILAGVFVHEAFGHLSEADFIYENENMREIMKLGKRFGGKHLNIVDGAAVPNLRGSYKYDDEGVPATKTYLIREGTLVGRLHSRETSAKMNEAATGNARAINYRYPPIVRMTNTYIEPGSASFEDIIGDIKEGIYVRNWYGGTTSMEMFTFSSGEAYMIRNGKVAEMLRPVMLTGNVFSTLHNIDAIGNDLEMNEGGGCGKSAQSPLPVSNGSPHIRIRSCLIGGK